MSKSCKKNKKSCNNNATSVAGIFLFIIFIILLLLLAVAACCGGCSLGFEDQEYGYGYAPGYPHGQAAPAAYGQKPVANIDNAMFEMPARAAAPASVGSVAASNALSGTVVRVKNP